jgi:hypothetical protein
MVTGAVGWQAENEEDYKDWIKAIRSQTETLLVRSLHDCCVIKSTTCAGYLIAQ